MAELVQECSFFQEGRGLDTFAGNGYGLPSVSNRKGAGQIAAAYRAAIKNAF